MSNFSISRGVRCMPISPLGSTQIGRNQTLDDHHIEPTTIEFSMLFIDTYLAETVLPTERPTRLVEQEDTGEQLPQPEPFGFDDQSREEDVTDAQTTTLTPDVHRELTDASVAIARTVGPGAGPAHDLFRGCGDDSRVASGNGLEPGAAVLRRP